MRQNKHIAVFGYPRSGSTMLYCMLRATVQGYKFYDREVRASDAFRRDPLVNKITKNPMDIEDVAFLAENVPGIKFVLCIRDPRSVLVSKVADGRFKVNWNTCLHKKEGIIGTNEGFIERHELVEKTLKYHPFIVKYEDLVNSPEKVQAELNNVLNLTYEGKFSDFYKTEIPQKLKLRLNGIRPVKTDRIESWREYPKRIYKQFMECPELFQILKFWGYEENNNWFEEMRKELQC